MLRLCRSAARGLSIDLLDVPHDVMQLPRDGLTTAEFSGYTRKCRRLVRGWAPRFRFSVANDDIS
jgi:hypothetical protein